MDQQNIDKLISNYLSKNIKFSDENIFAAKLSLLDTLGCIYNASTYDDPMRFATRDVYKRQDDTLIRPAAKYIGVEERD